MKIVRGIHLPDSDTHFEQMILAGPVVDGRGTYQWKKYEAARKFVKRWNHAVDIGGHVGLWTRVMALDFARVTAFEPHPAHIECFKANLISDNITLHDLALGREEGEAHIQMPADNTGNAHINKNGVLCRMVRLDDMRLEPVDFLKIDVEGYEYEVLLGAKETVLRDKPVIVVEQKPGHSDRYGYGQWKAVEYLQSLGMRQSQVISGDHIMVW